MTAAIRAQLLAAGAKLPASPSQKPATLTKQTERHTDTPKPAASFVGQEITFPGKIPGLNGAGGLLRMHWRRAQQLKKAFLLQVMAAGLRPMPGPVRFELIRYSTGQQMDFENLTSTGKYPTDALVKAGILPDDNPTIIQERTYTQTRVATAAEQRTVIRLTSLQP
jgi:hypothetical protein